MLLTYSVYLLKTKSQLDGELPPIYDLHNWVLANFPLTIHLSSAFWVQLLLPAFLFLHAQLIILYGPSALII